MFIVFSIILLSFIEALTEFAPVSSTAHLLLFVRLLGLESNPAFEVAIIVMQLGAILAVVFLYKNRSAQIKICRFLLLLLTANTLLFASLMICYPNSITLNYSIFATPAQAFLVFLALRGIKKDEEKVRSVDRIR